LCSVGHPLLFARVTLLTFFLFLALLAEAAEPLNSIGRIRSLSPEEAAGNLPVVIELTVTFYDHPQPAMLAHDGREGIFISVPRTVTDDLHFGAGTRLRIEGVTQPG